MQKLTALISTIAIAALVILGGWWTVFIRSQLLETSRLEEANEKLNEQVRTQGDEIEQLNDDLELAQARVQELEKALWLLKLSHRVARVTVLDQQVDPADPSRVRTVVEFVELDEEGKPAGEPRRIEIEGKQLYIEGLVIKFEDSYVEGGDSLRGSSVAILKRVFSERQSPSEGTPLDSPRMHPLPNQDDSAFDPFYEDLWERFWDYANDPEAAAKKGVRAMHAEAPSIELRSGKTYRVELRASGGLSIQAEQ